MAAKKFFLLLFGISACLALSQCKAQLNSTGSAKVNTEQDSIEFVANKVLNWQLDSIKKNGFRHSEDDWTNGALYTGIIAYAKFAKNDPLYQTLKQLVGEKLAYKLNADSNRYFADFYCVGQLYTDLYAKYKDPKMLADLKELADTLLKRPHTESLLWENKINRREWAWCDALFMGPPMLGKLSQVTNDQRYLDLSNKLWWKTTEYLYDKDEHLFYRDSRFFDRKEANGKKVFWSRGNGWVLAGMARLMETMPSNYPDRKKYNELFKAMAQKIASLQQADGTWRTSLLDPDSFPSEETSGTAFFCYSLAWGINNGLLSKNEYLPIVNKAWDALVNAIQPNGMLGFVQPIGNKAKAEIKATDTEVYGVGGFLLAATELMKMKR
jgi:unsaturated rhamnogalacturonyl hydrolase